MKKALICTLIFPILSLSQANAQSIDEDLLSAGFEATKANSSDYEGKPCYDYIDKKGWVSGLNQKSDGNAFYVTVGSSIVKEPFSSNGFVTSKMNASISSQLDAKSQLAQILSKQIVSEITTTIKNSSSTGQLPQEVSQELMNKARPYEDLGLIEKLTLFATQELDKVIDKNNKETVNQRANEAEEALRKAQSIINDQGFTDRIVAKSEVAIRGFKTLFSGMQLDGNKGTLCTVGIWSETLKNQADALATGDFSMLSGFKPGKPIRSSLPTKDTKKGYKQLLGTLGTFTTRDENGHLVVLSYAIEGVKGRLGESMAFDTARLKAERAIIQLQRENIEMRQLSESTERLVEYEGGDSSFFASSNNEKRIQAAASGKLTGANVVYRWNAKYINNMPMVGVIVAWSPSAAMLAQSASDILNERRGLKSNTLMNTTEKGQLAPNGKVSIGNSVGDDEEDF